MYVIQKSRTISDTIVLEDGEKSLKIEFSLDPTAIASSYWRLAGSLYFDREKVRKDPSPENLEALGKSFEALMQKYYRFKFEEIRFSDEKMVTLVEKIGCHNLTRNRARRMKG